MLELLPLTMCQLAAPVLLDDQLSVGRTFEAAQNRAMELLPQYATWPMPEDKPLAS